jgi:hypothetical protein
MVKLMFPEAEAGTGRAGEWERRWYSVCIKKKDWCYNKGRNDGVVPRSIHGNGFEQPRRIKRGVWILWRTS